MARVTGYIGRYSLMLPAGYGALLAPHDGSCQKLADPLAPDAGRRLGRGVVW